MVRVKIPFRVPRRKLSTEEMEILRIQRELDKINFDNDFQVAKHFRDIK